MEGGRGGLPTGREELRERRGERGRGEIEDVSSHAFIRNVSRGTFPFPIHGTVLCVITGFGKL